MPEKAKVAIRAMVMLRGQDGAAADRNQPMVLYGQINSIQWFWLHPWPFSLAATGAAIPPPNGLSRAAAGGDAAFHRCGIGKDDATGLHRPQLHNVDQHLRPETAVLLLSFVRPALSGLPGRMTAATEDISPKANCSRGRTTPPDPRMVSGAGGVGRRRAARRRPAGRWREAR
jgi:hypothetical protein